MTDPDYCDIICDAIENAGGNMKIDDVLALVPSENVGIAMANLNQLIDDGTIQMQTVHKDSAFFIEVVQT